MEISMGPLVDIASLETNDQEDSCGGVEKVFSPFLRDKVSAEL
jgi:hypothetical protein